jgi:hypothetical protein
VYGTHYVDCTGEFPWVYEMIKRCHKTAQKKGAIVRNSCLQYVWGHSNGMPDHSASGVRVRAGGLGYLCSCQGRTGRARRRRLGGHIFGARPEVGISKHQGRRRLLTAYRGGLSGGTFEVGHATAFLISKLILMLLDWIGSVRACDTSGDPRGLGFRCPVSGQRPRTALPQAHPEK